MSTVNSILASWRTLESPIRVLHPAKVTYQGHQHQVVRAERTAAGTTILILKSRFSGGSNFPATLSKCKEVR